MATAFVSCPVGIASAEEIKHITTGDWKVLEWKEYNGNECVLVSPNDVGDSVALFFSARESRDYLLGVTDGKRDYPTKIGHYGASMRVDFSAPVEFADTYLFDSLLHFKSEEIYFSFKSISEFFDVIDRLKIGANIFFSYDPQFAPTIVSIGEVGDGLEVFKKCVQSYR